MTLSRLRSSVRAACRAPRARRAGDRSPSGRQLQLAQEARGHLHRADAVALLPSGQRVGQQLLEQEELEVEIERLEPARHERERHERDQVVRAQCVASPRGDGDEPLGGADEHAHLGGDGGGAGERVEPLGALRVEPRGLEHGAARHAVRAHKLLAQPDHLGVAHPQRAARAAQRLSARAARRGVQRAQRVGDRRLVGLL
eukprot:scaffold51583_cov74-Phaeocystis_antarctica.AAC.2